MRKPKTNFISKYKYKRNLGVIAQFLWKTKPLGVLLCMAKSFFGRDCTINNEIQFWKITRITQKEFESVINKTIFKIYRGEC
jgi:hypothetical protein